MSILRRVEGFLYGDGEPGPPGVMRRDERIEVIVDHRERAGGFADALAGRLEGRHDLRVATLERGDVLLGDRLAIERKRADDFVQSLRDGRLFQQVAALAEEFPERALLLEGTFSVESVGGTNPDALRGAMVSLQFDWGIRILRTRDVEESASYVLLLADRLARRSSGRSATRRADPGAKAGGEATGRELVEAMLSVLPGIGPARAQAIAASHPDMASLLAASPRDFERIEGVGPVVARRLHHMLHAPG